MFCDLKEYTHYNTLLTLVETVHAKSAAAKAITGHSAPESCEGPMTM